VCFELTRYLWNSSKSFGQHYKNITLSKTWNILSIFYALFCMHKAFVKQQNSDSRNIVKLKPSLVLRIFCSLFFNMTIHFILGTCSFCFSFFLGTLICINCTIIINIYNHDLDCIYFHDCIAKYMYILSPRDYSLNSDFFFNLHIFLAHTFPSTVGNAFRWLQF